MHLARILVKPVFENGLYQQPKRLGPVLSQIDLISISIFIFVVFFFFWLVMLKRIEIPICVGRSDTSYLRVGASQKFFSTLI
jgi:hypothetical protein